MNPDVNTGAYQDRIILETEVIYDDDFLVPLNDVGNALDEMHAGTFMEHRRVYYRKPHLESGTIFMFKLNYSLMLLNLHCSCLQMNLKLRKMCIPPSCMEQLSSLVAIRSYIFSALQ